MQNKRYQHRRKFTASLKFDFFSLTQVSIQNMAVSVSSLKWAKA